MSSRARAAASVLLRHVGPRVFGPAAPSATTPRPLLALAGGGQGLWARLLSIGASEARADVAEVDASKGNHLSPSAVMAEVAIIAASEAKADLAEVYHASQGIHLSPSAVKAEVALISASEAKADLAEVYASKVNYANIAEVKSAVAEEASKKAK